MTPSRPHRHLIYQKVQIIRLFEVGSAHVHHCAKFGENRPNCCGDIAIYRIFKMAAVTILVFQKCKFLLVCILGRLILHHHA